MNGLSCAVFLPRFNPCSSLPDSKAEQTLSARAPALHRLREAFRQFKQRRKITQRLLAVSAGRITRRQNLAGQKPAVALLRTYFDLALVCDHGEPRVAFAQL